MMLIRNVEFILFASCWHLISSQFGPIINLDAFKVSLDDNPLVVVSFYPVDRICTDCQLHEQQYEEVAKELIQENLPVVFARWSILNAEEPFLRFYAHGEAREPSYYGSMDKESVSNWIQVQSANFFNPAEYEPVEEVISPYMLSRGEKSKSKPKKYIRRKPRKPKHVTADARSNGGPAIAIAQAGGELSSETIKRLQALKKNLPRSIFGKMGRYSGMSKDYMKELMKSEDVVKAIKISRNGGTVNARAIDEDGDGAIAIAHSSD